MNWDTPDTFEVSKEGSCPQCAAKQRFFCDMTDAQCQSLQQFQQRLAGKDLGDCQAEWFEHKVFTKGSYSQRMEFLGLLFQDNEIRLTVEEMAHDGLISLAKQIQLVDLDTDMKLSFVPAQAGKVWNGMVVGKLTGFREAQIMLCKISQLLLECKQKELNVLNWKGFQLSKNEWLRIFQRHNIKMFISNWNFWPWQNLFLKQDWIIMNKSEALCLKVQT
jgi:hypothetical protein